MQYLLWGLLVGLLIVDISLIIYIFVTKVLEPGAVYFQTKDKTVKTMLKLANVTSKDTLIDLGSGNGKIVIAAAKLGARAIGYEINPLLVLRSRRLIKKYNLEGRATIYWQSFWKADVKSATVITVYLIPQLMDRLHQWLSKYIDHPVKIVSNDYPIPMLTFQKRIGKIFLYKIDGPNITNKKQNSELHPS